ncbi:MAG: hypothetical protein JWM80_1168 [Cyanobacteria bacterium RYN_339]|nr:hypothetical protein [Cyanobacteria bacterium RYN_339]
MNKIIVAALGLSLLAGCGTVGVAGVRVVAQKMYAAQVTAKGQAAKDGVVAQVQALVAKAKPGAKIALDPAKPWIEAPHENENDPKLLQFDLMTKVAGEPVEFYGQFDPRTGKLVPQSLLVLPETEATFIALTGATRR